VSSLWLRGMLGAAALLLAFWAGTRVAPRPAPPAPVFAEPVAARAALPAPVTVGGITRDDVRVVIREELARADRAATAPAEEAAPDPAEAAAIEQAHAAAATAIDQGIEDGVWNEADRHALRLQLVHLGPEETKEVLSPLFQAINDQRLQLDGPPI